MSDQMQPSLGRSSRVARLVRARAGDNASAHTAYTLLVQRAFTTTQATVVTVRLEIAAGVVRAACLSDPTRALANTAAAHLPLRAGGTGGAAVSQAAICGNAAVGRVGHRIDASSQTKHTGDVAGCCAPPTATHLIGFTGKRSGLDSGATATVMGVRLEIGAAPATLGGSGGTGLVALAKVTDLTLSASETAGAAAVVFRCEIHAVISAQDHVWIAGQNDHGRVCR